MPKTAEQVTEFIEALKDAGFDVHSYSGRGMMGTYCVSVHNASPWDVAQQLTGFSVPEPREDSLGKGNVLYWPSFPWPEVGGERD